MTSLAINSFAGSVPRSERHLLPRSASTKAVDCRLDSGAVASWFEKAHEATLSGFSTNGYIFTQKLDCTGWQSVYIPVNERSSSDCPEDFTEANWFVSEPFKLVTGRFRRPSVIKWNGSSWTYLGPLAPPVPVGKPILQLNTDYNIPETNREYRLYAFQLRNAAGFWGPLSEAYAVTSWDSMSAYTFSLPSGQEAFTAVRLYRTVAAVGSSMPTLANTMENTLDTNWLLVYEDEASNPSAGLYDYYVPNEELTQGLEEDVVIPPPDNLKGITEVISMRCFAGFAGNQLFFSENNNPGNWPHIYTLDDNICGIVESNGMLYVATDGHPYVVSAIADCDSADCRSIVRLSTSLPMASCNKHAMIAMPQGAVYVSHKGLVAIAGPSNPTLISHSLYSAEQWQHLVPQSMRLAVYVGKLFVFGKYGSFSMNIAGGPEAGWPLDNHVELSDKPDDVFVTREGDLFLREGDELYKWNAGLQRRPHYWESPEIVVNTEVNLGAGHVRLRGGPEEITVRVDDKLALNRAVITSKQFRLPNWAVGTRWSFVLEGTAEVQLVSLATSMRELTA